MRKVAFVAALAADAPTVAVVDAGGKTLAPTDKKGARWVRQVAKIHVVD